MITDNLMADYNWYDFLDEKVQSHLSFLKTNYGNALNESLINCESPIEQLLSLYLISLSYGFNYWNPFIDFSWPYPGQEIKCKNGKKYRLDFYFVVMYKNQETKYFGIECDGYDFHQKTKEQVEYDNQRQRDLQNEGIEIIRFSGSEIWKRPAKCAGEVQDIILSNCKYISNNLKGEEQNE